MSVSVKELGIDRLNIEDRLALVEEIWESICSDTANFPLTEFQREELDRRIEDDDKFPDDVTSWNNVKSSARVRMT